MSDCDPMEVACQVPLSMEFSIECTAVPSSRGYFRPRDSTELRSSALQADSLPVEPQGKPKNTGVGSLFLLQQIFPTQESNWGLLPTLLYQLSYQGIHSSKQQYDVENNFLSFFKLEKKLRERDVNQIKKGK